MMSKLMVCAVSTAACFSHIAIAQQNWVDPTGKYTVSASFKELVGEDLTLEKPAGEVLKIPLSKLSQKSQDLARFLASDSPELLKNLRSDDPAQRLQAAQTIIAGRPLPGIAKDDIIRFVNLELEALETPVTRKRGKVVLDGTEISLLKVKADPQLFLNKPIVFCGRLTVSDYYNYSFENSKDSHYSFQCDEVLSGNQSGESVYLYIRREFGKALMSEVSDHRDGIVIRVVATPTIEQWELMNLDDWQHFDTTLNKWGPSTMAGINSALGLIDHMTDASTMMSIVNSPNTFKAFGDLPIRVMALRAAKKLTLYDDADVSAFVAAAISDGPTDLIVLNQRIADSCIKILSESDAKLRNKAVVELKKIESNKNTSVEAREQAIKVINHLETIRR